MATISFKFQAKTLVEQGKVTQSAIDEIKIWLASVQRDEIPKLSDEFIALMLLACGNVTDVTKTKIQLFFKYKNNAPEMFENRDFDGEELQKSLSVVTICEIPTRTESNNALFMFRLKDTRFSKFQMSSTFKLAFMVLERSQLSNPPDGVIVCLDMTGVGLMHLTRLKLGTLQKFIQFIDEALSSKLLAFYFLNANYVFDSLFKIIKVFLSEELVKIVKPVPVGVNIVEFCTNHFPIPDQCLPKEYGGVLPNLDQLSQTTVEELRKDKEFFILEEKWRKSKD